MALVVADRVQETTTTTGTGTYTLAGAKDGFQSFGAVGDGNTTYYACTDGTDYEVGIGTYTATGTTLARTTIIESSNSDAAVNWGAGSKDIFVTLPASKALVQDASDDVTLADNEKLIFGTGPDLQLYHDGTHSYISDTGTGHLKVLANSLLIQNSLGNNRIFADQAGPVNLYYGTDASPKLVTSSTGIQTTGTVNVNGAYTLPTADGTNGQVLTTDGAGAVTFADAGGNLELYAENPSTPTAPSATGTNAVAIGDGASATNNYSLAIGGTASASNSTAVAIGYGATASSGSSLALGRQASATTGGFNTALGYNAVAAGSGGTATALANSYASGSNSFAAAITNNTSSYGATGANSIAMGYQAKATAANALAIGRLSEATSSSGISIGYNNLASGSNGTCFGRNSTASGFLSSTFGNYATASGAYSLVLSNNNDGIGTKATQTHSIAIGNGATSDIRGKIAYGNGYFSGLGDGQAGTFILRSDTTDATAEALTSNNGTASTTNQIILPNNSAYSFSGTIIARQDAASGSNYASWEIKGALLRDANAASTVLGNGIVNKLYATAGASAWAVALTADTTNGGLKVEVTGAAATNIRWVATVNTSEVTYA